MGNDSTEMGRSARLLRGVSAPWALASGTRPGSPAVKWIFRCPVVTQILKAFSKAPLGFELLLAMKYHVRQLFAEFKRDLVNLDEKLRDGPISTYFSPGGYDPSQGSARGSDISRVVKDLKGTLLFINDNEAAAYKSCFAVPKSFDWLC
ncbi:hypothetical protein EVAR_34015_1 [Eumeta japonica]|uniref:Uncharacterized protein n=1 Tax=Eumeta variegata TaxID=151549 RepID=A0A4C1VT96_EUMVA|nr:hypothetical protein EVAR_34015_1 [Eumeta japonica]